MSEKHETIECQNCLGQFHAEHGVEGNYADDGTDYFLCFPCEDLLGITEEREQKWEDEFGNDTADTL